MTKRPIAFRDFILSKASDWVLMVLDFADQMKQYQSLRLFVDQLIRSSTSVGANIYESQGCNSRKQYAHFLEIAMRSGHESSYWLYLVEKRELRLAMRARVLRKESIEIEKVLQKTLISLRAK